jgi:DeoR/GlpR family transcriptional regulator of sugar metabolism
VAPDSKLKVASVAAGLVRPGGTLILDGGTTALAVARALPEDLACTVITHSPTVAVALLDHPRAELHLLGGRVFKHSAVTCGAAAVEAAQNVTADLCLLGVTGVHPEAGLTTGDAEEAAMKRALSARAADTYILASSEKIGTASRFRVLPWEKVSGLITDADPQDTVIELLAAAGVEVLAAD